MISFAFVLAAGVILASALAAVCMRKMVHSVLCLAITFIGLAAIYLQLGAEFIGFAQILVYVGAVAILMVFAVLLTHNSGPDPAFASPSWRVGVSCAFFVFGCLALCLLTSSFPGPVPAPPLAPPEISVKTIGLALLEDHVLPLEVMGLLLTATLIGAVVLAQGESASNAPKSPPPPCPP